MAHNVQQRDGLFLWLRAETYLHVGVGQVASLVDLPFAREAATQYPYIPGSGMKGAFRAAARLRWPGEKPAGGDDAAPEERGQIASDDADGTDEPRAIADAPEVKQLFGIQDDGGSVLVSDARIALLPLRSLDRGFVLATCPHVLGRLARDRRFAGRADGSCDADGKKTVFAQAVQALGGGVQSSGYFAAFSEPEKNATSLIVEDYELERSTRIQDSDMEFLCEMFGGCPDWTETVKSRLVVLNDADFAYFCRTSLHVRTRNRLDANTKTVVQGQLWSEESLPPETVLYGVISPRDGGRADAISKFDDMIKERSGYLQVGGNETVGEGWLSIHAATDAASEGKSKTDAPPKGEQSDAA